MSYSLCNGTDVGRPLCVEIVERQALEHLHPLRYYPDKSLALFNTPNSKAYVMDAPEQAFYYLDHYDEFYRHPKTVNFEPAASCNLTCTQCFYYSDKYPENLPPKETPKLMPLELHNKIIDDMAAVQDDAYIEYCWRGEPLLNKKLPEMVAYAADKGFTTSIASNATLLNEDTAEALIDAGLYSFNFSIDGASSETFEKIRIGANYNQVVDNMKKFIELGEKRKNPPLYIVRNVNLEENAQEAMTLVDQWIDTVDIIVIQHEAVPERHNWHNLNSQESLDFQRYPCHLLFRNAMIGTNGNIGACNVWYKEEPHEVIGNVAANSFDDVWAGEEWSHRRKLALEGRYDEVPLCNGCDGVTCSSSVISKDYINDGKVFVRQHAANFIYTRVDNKKIHPELPWDVRKGLKLEPHLTRVWRALMNDLGKVA